MTQVPSIFMTPAPKGIPPRLKDEAAYEVPSHEPRTPCVALALASDLVEEVSTSSTQESVTTAGPSAWKIRPTGI